MVVLDSVSISHRGWPDTRDPQRVQGKIYLREVLAVAKLLLEPHFFLHLLSTAATYL